MAQGLRAQIAIALLVASLPLTARPQTPIPPHDQRYFVLHAGTGQTIVPLFGDTNKRNNLCLGLSYVKPERFFRIGRKKGDMFQELYYEHSASKGGDGTAGHLPSDYEAVGYLFGVRYGWALGRYGLYGDIGWGFQYNNHRTIDLPSRLNSTPFLDVGLWIPNGRHPLLLGIRYLHSSNGGTVGTNAGQNQFFLDIGVKL